MSLSPRHRNAARNNNDGGDDSDDSGWSTPEELRQGDDMRRHMKKRPPPPLRLSASPNRRVNATASNDGSPASPSANQQAEAASPPLASSPTATATSGGVADGGSAAPGNPRAATVSNVAADLLAIPGEKFPTYDELQLLPEEIRETLLDLVKDYFRRRVYPRAVLNFRRKRSREAVKAAQETVPHITPQYLQSIPFFSRWSNLDAVARNLELKIFEPHEVITHEGDITQSGIIFLAQGTMAARKKRGLSNNKQQPGGRKNRYAHFAHLSQGQQQNHKSLSDANTVLTAQYEAPAVYGEMIFLTEQPRLESLKAVTRCFIFTLSKSRFFSLLHALPEERQRGIIDHAYAQRRENILRVFPVTGARLRTLHLFSHVPEELLNNLAPKMEPRAFPANHTFCKVGDNGTDMFYIVRGTVTVTAMIPSSDGASLVPSASSHGPGSIVGEMSGLFMQKRAIVATTQTPVDLYAFTREQIQSAIPNTSLTNEMLTRAHALQAEQQVNARRKYADAISQIPFVKDFAPTTKGLLAALLEEFKPQVYAPGSTLLSVSSAADRLIIVTRGRARLSSNGRELRLRECLGFTCLVPHRWQYAAIAHETLETLELNYAVFGRVCKRFGVYEEIRDLTMGLLYPRVYPEMFQKALPMLRHCENPPCFPSSQEYEVKPFAARQTSKPMFEPTEWLNQKNFKAGEEGHAFAGRPAKLPPIQTIATSIDTSGFLDDPATDPNATTVNPTAEKDDNNDTTNNNALEPTQSMRRSSIHRSSENLKDHQSTSSAKPLTEQQQRMKEREEHWNKLASPSRRNGGRTGGGTKNSQAELDRLSKKIKELQMATLAKVQHAPMSRSNKLQPLASRSDASQASSTQPTPQRKKRTKKRTDSPLHSDENNNDKTVTDSPDKASPKPQRQPLPAWQRRTIAIQTSQSYLMTRARLLASRAKPQSTSNDNENESINEGNDAVGVRAGQELTGLGVVVEVLNDEDRSASALAMLFDL